jgi:hypothetical protein
MRRYGKQRHIRHFQTKSAARESIGKLALFEKVSGETDIAA